MSSEEKLTALYARRQEILKDLSEVDTSIKFLESEIQTKATEAAKRTIDENKSGNADVDRVNEVIASCVRDATGLRDALKLVEACRYVQEFGKEDDAARQKIPFRNVFAQECIRHALDLSNDANGSELMQHLVPLLRSGTKPVTMGDIFYDPTTNEHDLSEVLLLIRELSSDIVTVACNTNGARVSQRIIDVLCTHEEFDVYTSVLEPSIVDVAKDINGNHSLSKLITSARFCQLGDSDKSASGAAAIYERIFQKIADNCIDICKNRQGCCIIQKCLQHAPKPYHTTIINTVLNNSLKLVQDPFGNYVVQFILDKQQDINGSKKEDADDDAVPTAPNYTNQIIRQMLHHVAELSCNKFSSNVIEKCLKTSSPDVRQLLVDELTAPHVLPKLLTDSFANYVIQTAISTASDDGQLTQLRDAIIPLQSLLKNSPYGVKIESKLSRRHREAARRLLKKKEAATTVTQAPPAQQEPLLPPYMPPQGMSAIPMMAPDASMGQQVSFTNLNADMASFLQPQRMIGMPFVLQGQQMISIPNAPPPSFTMGMINGSGLPEYR
ncbi:PUF1 / Pumilio family (PUF) protein 1 [Leishmania donovani]|uniref:PUF1_-_putative n=3 Tax=Leishmania donovani species complex TaxID=38574 RepID=A0A6L0XTF1_LEIIN|nr:putative PUF1 [Leishmania infantum JPCM5]XP_003865123.1 PUF1, putative [Leishmania donovani]CAC9548389.1 PUF1_-_putative [Leishmania infantum]TPP42436.1 Pumilio-family RNA binding repeat protein [Leishmania donovani]TPP48121.1 Pumilio-family RNA binding repeat protein [Leishmania donovani]CAJ1993361.1 PUF1 / Pumilio family (PUF) protein 1 [Leishmania donovani]CAM72712.1 putative PUF1 [Leishmania infantum JPCM5]|eukprot:XP_001469602.1 putative PUF1 [Leishmania infantum JPCM5]